MAAALAKSGKSVVTMLRGILSTVNSMSSASIALAHAMPGMGIAIGAAEVVVRTFDLFEAWEHADNMRMRKQDFKGRFGVVAGKGGSSKAEAILKDATSSAVQKEEAEEYLHFKSLQYVQDKNARRALLNIGIGLGEIAGDVATLGGASAPVGMGIKLGALCTKIGATIVRNLKQFGRDMVDKSRQKKVAAINADPTLDAPAKAAKIKEVEDATTIFNLNKTSAKKLAGYKSNVTTILTRFAAFDAATQDKMAWMHLVHEFEATGVRLTEAKAILDKGENLGVAMIKALQRREK